MRKIKPGVKLNIFGYQNAMGSSGSKAQERPTPKHIYDQLDRVYHFTRDVCASDVNFKHPNYWTKKDNCLTKKWSGVCFMNPPYAYLQEFMRKAYEERHNAITVCFIPIMTNVGWFHEFVVKGEVYFIKGRPKFEGAKSGFPQPMAIVVFGKEEGKFGTLEFKELKKCNKCGDEFLADKRSKNMCDKCVTKTCKVCGKVYLKRSALTLAKMCDECRDSKRMCNHCGKPTSKDKNGRPLLYCSPKCANDWFFANKRKGAWNDQRTYLLDKLGNKCEVCGSTEKITLRIRGKVGLRPWMYGGYMDNDNWRKLGILCQSCHSHSHDVSNKPKKILGIFNKH